MKTDVDGAGFDEKRLERIADHLTRRYLLPEKIAGCQVAVARRGSVAYFRSLGSMDLERGKRVADDTIWRIYSMTKPVTAVALLTLYERGNFQLSDEVSRWIPEWRGLQVREVDHTGRSQLVEPRRPMSVRDALMHTTGLGFGSPRAEDEEPAPDPGRSGQLLSLLATGREGQTLESLCARLAERPLRFHPGERWFYSVSTDVCARLVEVMSGQRFDEYLTDAVLGPLGMHDTAFSVSDDDLSRFAAMYRRGSDKRLKLADDPERSSYRATPTFLSGGAGLVSTTADYLRFAQMLTNGGEIDGVRILGRRTVEMMATNHLPGGADLREVVAPGSYGETGFDGMGFGLTVAVGQGCARTQVVGSPGSFTWGGAASTVFWCDPAEDLTVVFMTQLLPSGTFNFRDQLKALVYGAIAD